MRLKATALLCFCLGLVSLASCGLFRKEKPVAVKPDLVIGYFPSSDMLPFYLALQQGYFDSLQVRPFFLRMESKLHVTRSTARGGLTAASLT